MTIIEVPGELMDIIKVPVSGDFISKMIQLKVLDVPGKLTKILNVPMNFGSKMAKY